MKPKKCKVCKQLFTPLTSLHSLCGYDCSVINANTLKAKREALEAKQERKETKEKLAKLKTRQEYLKDAQRFFNLYIRLRDADLPCISCGRFHTGQYHAGHYRTVGSSPHHRFNENNVHKQCSACNNYLSGNITNYRHGLLKKIGLHAVEQLESDNSLKNYTIDEIKQIKVTYKEKIKELTQ